MLLHDLASSFSNAESNRLFTDTVLQTEIATVARPTPFAFIRRLTPRWVLLIVCALFVLQVLPYLSYRWVTDESWYAGPGLSLALGEGLKDPAIGPNDIENHVDARPPGTALVIAAAFKTFGIGQVAARLGSVLAGLFTVLLTYLLARRWFGRHVALFTALLIGTDNLLILSSRTARPEAFTVLFVLLSLLLVDRYYRSSLPLLAAAAGLGAAIGTTFHITLLGYIVSSVLLLSWIDYSNGKFPLRGSVLYSAGFACGLLPYALWVFTTPRGVEGFRAEFLSRAATASLLEKFLQEGRRYSDVLGLHLLPGHLLGSLPIRLPIPLFLLFSGWVLWRCRARWFYLALVLTVPSLLWFIYTVNKSSRYLTLLSPVTALVVGAAIAATLHHRNLRRLMMVGAGMVIVAQFAGNLTLLAAARKANYHVLASELRNAVPDGEAVYGTITFWLAFHDQPYISYERTWPLDAEKQFHVRYFIAGDRMMQLGDDRDNFYEKLNQQMKDIEARSDVVRNIEDPYYGHLSVYRVHR